MDVPATAGRRVIEVQSSAAHASHSDRRRDARGKAQRQPRMSACWIGDGASKSAAANAGETDGAPTRRSAAQAGASQHSWYPSSAISRTSRSSRCTSKQPTISPPDETLITLKTERATMDVPAISGGHRREATRGKASRDNAGEARPDPSTSPQPARRRPEQPRWSTSMNPEVTVRSAVGAGTSGRRRLPCLDEAFTRPCEPLDPQASRANSASISRA